jgi:sulfhydrogenase subunit beta (sulfur reductase)
MTDQQPSIGNTVALAKPELDGLLADLRRGGFRTVGPRARDEGIVYAEIESLADLPRGIQTAQKPASYRMTQTSLNRYFDYIPGSQSWKQFLFPPRTELFTARKESGKWKLDKNAEEQPRCAFIGVRACELAAIEIQDRVFMRPEFSDPVYRARREGLFLLAVNCTHPNDTCFCTSMGTGPAHKAGYDLCLTELDDVFLVQVGSELGRSLLAKRTFDLPSAFVQKNAAEALENAARSITRTLDTGGLPELLMDSLESGRWTEIAKRCLSCANCTQVCPTCFCWDATDVPDLTGKTARRERVWDSCFNLQYSYMAGGNTRPTIRSRYRQWLTHKLSTWKDQFGVPGCVGCGRCITWCPASIDLTVEVPALRGEVKK